MLIQGRKYVERRRYVEYCGCCEQWSQDLVLYCTTVTCLCRRRFELSRWAFLDRCGKETKLMPRLRTWTPYDKLGQKFHAVPPIRMLSAAQPPSFLCMVTTGRLVPDQLDMYTAHLTTSHRAISSKSLGSSIAPSYRQIAGEIAMANFLRQRVLP